MAVVVHGIRDLDGKFGDMIALKLLCERTGCSYPPELRDYFRYPEENAEYLQSQMEEVDISSATTEYKTECSEGFNIDVAAIPSEVKTIRCVGSK